MLGCKGTEFIRGLVAISADPPGAANAKQGAVLSRTQRWRRTLVALFVGALAAALAVAAPAGAQTETDAAVPMEQKADPDLLARIDAEGEAEI